MNRLATLASMLPFVKKMDDGGTTACVAAVVPSWARDDRERICRHGGDDQNFAVDLDTEVARVGKLPASVTVQLVAVVVVIAADNVVTA